MNAKKWMTVCAAVAVVLVIAAATLAALAVPAAPAPLAVSTVTHGGYADIDKRWQYTKADYEFVLASMTTDYEKLPLAAFNSRLLDWKDEDAFHKGEESLDRLMCSYPDDKPNAGFIDTTIRASFEELSTRHYGGNCAQMAPTYWDCVQRVRNEDVFGDQVPVFVADASYDIKYRIADEEKITVGERDALFTAYRDAVQSYLGGKTEQELKSTKTMQSALSKELVRLDKQLSTDNVKLTSTLGDYYVDDYRDWN